MISRIPRTVVGIALAWAVAACSERPTELKQVDGKRAATVIAPTATLDQSVIAILTLFPKGLATASTARWDNIKRKYAAGLTDPSQMAVAKQMVFELSDWINQETAEMGAPPNNEPKSGAAARAVLYMSMYVYNGPETNPPPFTPSADVVVGLVTPGAPATIVTPTLHAGVQLEAGSVAQNTIFVVTQNPTPYPDNCSGPLQTKLCQYPQFYTFDMFPHVRLLKAGKFNVCHVNTGENRYPLESHNGFRLAHTKPADPADYTPGSTIRDQNGESIEILPLVPQTFSTCVGNAYTIASAGGGPLDILSRFAKGLRDLVSPKTVYAIDVGLGGLSIDTSPFNDVDPAGLPDIAVQSVGVGEGQYRPGDHIPVSYSVKNIGTATDGSVPFTIHLLQPGEGAPTDIQVGTGSIPSLVPGASVTATNSDAVVPASLAPGSYTIRFDVGSDPIFPDASVANNSGTSTITVPRPAVVRVCTTTITTDPQTVPTLNLAMDYVAEGGTVRICDGTYMVTAMNLNLKSMTIEGEGPGRPILDASNTSQVFYMDSPTPVNTSVILRRLRLQGGQYGEIGVLHHHAALLIDNVEFHPPLGPHNNPILPDVGYLSGVGVFDAVGTGVTVQNSTFVGGDIGVLFGNAQNVVLVNNTFTGQLNAAIHGGNGGDLLAANNTISHCGIHWCVGIFNNGVTGNFNFFNNNITIDYASPTDVALRLHHSTFQVRGNTITGVGGFRDPATPTSWPINYAIFINDTSSATISGNHISGAYVGFHFLNGTSVIGSDNVVTGVSQGMRVFDRYPPQPSDIRSAVAITRSDFTNYATAIDTDSPAGIAVCNWWGSAAGPHSVAPWISPATYTPWTSSPVANQPAVSCDPTAGVGGAAPPPIPDYVGTFNMDLSGNYGYPIATGCTSGWDGGILTITVTHVPVTTPNVTDYYSGTYAITARFSGRSLQPDGSCIVPDDTIQTASGTWSENFDTPVWINSEHSLLRYVGGWVWHR